MTIASNEMSVCVLRIIGDQSVPSAPAATNEFWGANTVLFREDESGGMTLASLIAAPNLAELRTLAGLPPAKKMSIEDTILEVKMRFADQTWMAMVYPEKSFGSFGSFDESRTTPSKLFENDDEEAVWSKVMADFATIVDAPFEVSCVFSALTI